MVSRTGTATTDRQTAKSQRQTANSNPQKHVLQTAYKRSKSCL